MDKLLSIFLRALHPSRFPDGDNRRRQANTRFGDGTGPAVAVRFTTRSAQRAVLFNPELRVGEAYMDGTFVVDQGSIADVMAILLRQEHIAPPRWALPHCGRRATCSAVCSNSTCALGRAGTSRITTTWTAGSISSSSTPTSNIAARISRRRISRSTTLNSPNAPPGGKASRPARRNTVLDIGCGWGGLALYLAEIADAHVTGITLSKEQHARAQQRALWNAAGARMRCSASKIIATCREPSIASCRSVCSSMSASAFTTTFFRKAPELLDEDGVFLLHTIGRSGSPSVTNPWIAKYIFPRRLHSGLVGSACPRFNAREADRNRRRDPATALRRDA